MRILITVITLLFLSSCSEMVDKPKNLLSKEQMSEIIADFAIYDQSYTVKPDTNMDLVTRFVLKKNKTNANIYRESYKYYLAKPNQLDQILEDAKEIIVNKDPKMEEYIKKKKKENPNLPAFVK